ncbi:MAG: TIM barrel protein [Planctomycetales bacterium]|nr:TIM barrel protein [Planctomycetales bacterium]
MDQCPAACSTRRQLLKSVVAGGVAAAAANVPAQGQDEAAFARKTATNGRSRVKQSVMAWCFSGVPTDELIAACAKMGLTGMEGISPEYYPQMKSQGLAVSLVSSHGFQRGPVNPANREFCVSKLRECIDLAVEWHCENVITFTGMREQGISDEQSQRNCVDCWREVIPYAEEKGVNLALEHLNSRDDSHPMKGHPGYFGDSIDRCVEMIRRVDSSRMKLLFDIYHVQIMQGDVIRRFREYQDLISHVHTAGVPGRGELDENQELNYPAIIRAILETGYAGYITQEFIPTWEDPLASLKYGVEVCDV